MLVDFLPKVEIINTVSYVQTLQKLQHLLHDKHQMKRHIIPQHNNSCPHIALLTLEKTEEVGWEVLLYPPFLST
jgi:hypothetical protein